MLPPGEHVRVNGWYVGLTILLVEVKGMKKANKADEEKVRTAVVYKKRWRINK